MTRKSSLDSHLCRLKVTDFSDEHDVRVLTQEGAKHLRERVSDVMVDRHLHDSVHIVFDRLLCGEDFGVDIVDATENGIEGGRLSGTGRSRNHDDAVGLFDVHRDLLVHVFRKTDVLKVERRCALVENTHNHRFAMGGGKTRHTKVDGTPRDVDRNASVLWNAAFGDVETRHDLDAGDDCRSHGDIRSLHRVKRAVHTVADLEILLERLDVDVGRAVYNTLIENQVHELDDGIVVRGAFERRDIVRIALESFVLIHS